MAEKVLVTGAAGLIGRELCKQLSKNFLVIGVDNNFRYPAFSPECTFIRSDLTEFLNSTKNNFKFVFHMAAINGTEYFYSIPNILIENNVTNDLAVFNFVKKNKECKLIYASSSEVVAGTNNFPTAEEKNVYIENIHNPRWSYRIPKILAENYLFNSNIDFLIARFFNVYSEHSGPGHFVYDIIQKIQKEDYSIIGHDETRSFCYVEDAVHALLQVYCQTNREVINIGSDEEINILEAANIIANKLNRSVEWKLVPGREGSVKRRMPDLTKLKMLVSDYRPTPFKQVIEERFNVDL
jgi:UDP-glucose 4-epimerase